MVDEDGGEASALASQLSRTSLTVISQIERANIVNLDWALAHMGVVKSKKTLRKASTAEDWVYEAEMKDTIEEEVGASTLHAPDVTLTQINVGGS